MKRGRTAKATPTDCSQTRGRDAVYKRKLFEKLGKFLYAALQDPKLRKQFFLDSLYGDLDFPEEFLSDLQPTEAVPHLVPQPEKVAQPIVKHIGFLKTELITGTYDAFKKNGLIICEPHQNGCTLEIFRAKFLGGETEKKIPWARGLNLLGFTIRTMMVRKFIPHYRTSNKVIHENFCDEHGRDFSIEKLRKANSKGVHDPNLVNMIDNMLADLLKKETLGGRL